jgi:type II secretion system protein G
MKSSGFTLIELLVVISIIGMLSSVVLSSLNTARGKARDAERLADMRQIRNALELYRSDFGVYPTPAVGWRGTCSDFGSHTTSGAAGYIPTLAPTYIPVLPTDPRPVGTNGCYLYTSNGIDYSFLVYLTVEAPASTIPVSLRRRGTFGGGNTYAMYSSENSSD